MFSLLKKRILVIISSDAEWRAFRKVSSPRRGYDSSPYGEFFSEKIKGRQRGTTRAVFFQGGWGKIDAAASAQYALTRFRPSLVINIGTAGGFPGLVEKGEIIAVSSTATYDIHEQMSDPDEATAYYSESLELPPIKDLAGIRSGIIVSADRDIFPAQVPELAERYGAIAGDWESSAIAHVAAKNSITCHILRGISDIVYPEGSEAYGSLETFEEASEDILRRIYGLLPEVL